MPAVLTAPAAPDPDDRDPAPDYVSEDELLDLGIDPGLVRVFCPWAAEFTGHGGARCWLAADLAPLFEGGDR